METHYILGYGAAIVIGFVLGLLGGGGSILTVPVLVYLVGIDSVLATAYSLFVVGSAASVGAVRYLQKKLLHLKSTLVFAAPSLATVYATRKFIIPAIPEEVFQLGDYSMSKHVLIMVFFASMMLLASYSMIKGRKVQPNSKETIHFDYPKICLSGMFTGLLAGLVGAGGGFLIIPALVLIIRLPMKLAVGTSLMIISINSLIGFLGDVSYMPIDWSFLLPFAFFAIIGILIGSYASQFVDGKKLKKIFGWFVLGMSLLILLKEIAL